MKQRYRNVGAKETYESDLKAKLESYLFPLQSWQILGTTHSRKGLLFPGVQAVNYLGPCIGM